ncbi:MAG: polyribonucleotide nucleotidyltransferase [Proteobacteria bacterium]|nr:polyribonucleotide nucleotidyltransferase [Pseudomonadota bacterium]
MSTCVKSFQYGNQTVSLETGVVARQASGAVMVNMDGTVVLVTAVGIKEEVKGRDFFPLTVNYQERMYAAGRIPGGFFKREGRPTENETLISRLIDRPLRPLFPAGFMNEVQIIATVMSINPEVNPDIPAMIGASAALAISGIPFNGPIGAARVGYINGELILNPSATQMRNSDLDLVVAGTASSVLMVESEANQLSDTLMLEAVMFGHAKMQIVIKAVQALAKDAGKATWTWQPSTNHELILNKLTQEIGSEIGQAYSIADKSQRQETLKNLRKSLIEKLVTPEGEFSEGIVLNAMSELEEKFVRGRILSGEPRIDGRDTETIRPISVQTSVLPRTHGSALFTRGETQAIVVATLGTGRDAQVIDNATGEKKEPFMLHYNFPPFCVGEVGMIGSPKRREIGHGRLARRAVQGVLPESNQFPYVMRVVSEITESNGSSSMASVCGTSLALMDAGVPLKSHVAGIAMGLIKEEDKFAILSDIIGDEDHLGDMDFKVAGTKQGITALQMDIKIDGITREIMEVAIAQARKGLIHILNIMEQAINAPRTEMSDFAPRVYTLKVNPEKIRDIIGKGGATIRNLTEETGTSIEVNDDGMVNIVANDRYSGEAVMKRIQALTEEVEVNRIYEGKVARIVDFGAFVTVLPGKDGLVHISQISSQRISDINQVLQVGQVVKVKVLEIDRQGRIRLSMKEVEPEGETTIQAAPESVDTE